MTDTQPVAQPEVPAQPGTEAPSAQNELDSLLSEFNQATETPKPAPPKQGTTDPNYAAIQARLDAFERERAIERAKSDTDKAVLELKGNSEVPNWVVKGWLMERAESDPRINQVWDNRDKNPAAAKKLLSALRTEFEKEQAKVAKPIDADATADRAAVAAAMKGASNKMPAEPAPNYGAMNDADFKKELAKYGL